MKRCCRFRRSREKSRRRPSQEKGEAGEEGEKFLKTEASPKRQRNQIRVLNTGSSAPEHREAEAKRPSSDPDRVFGAHVALKRAPHFSGHSWGHNRSKKTNRQVTRGSVLLKRVIPSLQITETRGSPQHFDATGRIFWGKMGPVEETHFLACCFRQHERRPAKSGLGP